MPQFYSATWTPERWREHALQMSLMHKTRNSGRAPRRTGMRWCPRCQRMRSRRNFHIAVRQPDGLQNYCKKCNRIHVRKHYWYVRLKQVSLTAPDEIVNQIIFKAGMALPVQEVLDLIDRWISEGRQ